MPYEHWTRKMVQYGAMEPACKLNYFPAKDGVSTIYSPRTIIHKRGIDYDKHCQFQFGQYGMTHDENNPTNTMKSRALHCIYLRPNDNDQGGHVLLNLDTNCTVTCPRFTPLPISKAIIERVHAIAESEGMPKGLKIVSRHGDILYDSALFAGVDSDDDEEDSDYEPSDDDSDSDDDEYESKSNDDDSDGNDEDIADDDLASVPEEPQEEEEANQTPVVETVEDEDDSDDDEMPELQEKESDDDDSDSESKEPPTLLRRSTQERKPPSKHKDYVSHLNVDDPFMAFTQSNDDNTVEYDSSLAPIIAKIMCHYGMKFGSMTDQEAYSFIQTYSLSKGIKKFGDRGIDSATSEMEQLHDRACWNPIHVSNLTPEERKRALESLIFLVEKRDGRIKSRHCANGSTQREYVEREEAASPTVSTESILITGAIEAKQNRDMATFDVPNAFPQTDIDEKN